MNKRSLQVLFCVSVFVITGYFFISFKDEKKDTAKALIKLGRYLFYDRRLSVNNSKACATCHNQNFAFTDGYKRSLGVYADLHQRNTQPIFNLGSYRYLTAADSAIHTTIQQMNNPLFNEHPKEMGVKWHEQEIVDRFKSDTLYQALFSLAFPNDKYVINLDNIKTSISQFINTIVSDSSSYDKYLKGDSAALTADQKAGKQLFFSDKLKCVSCHGGNNFSEPLITKNNTSNYFNTGLYNIDGKGAYPEYDQGLYEFTKKAVDMGKFRVPTLRNLVFTGPYFHDGSAASLNDVVDIYSTGGREITTGIYAGDGRTNPYKHTFITGFAITATEKNQLISFLLSLTDSTMIKTGKYSNPFEEDETKKKY